MSDGQPQGAANFKRRTWDKEFFARKARERAEHAQQEEQRVVTVKSDKEEFQAADAGAAGPAGSARAFLNARKSKVDLDSGVGKIKRTQDGKMRDGGYYCEVCECVLKDSVAYLDHINGKKHQRKLGFSMRVASSTVGDVKARFAQRKRAATDASPALDASAAFAARVAQAEREEELERQEKRAAKKRRKEDAKKATEGTDAVQAVDEDMIAMMGFSGFGSSKKK